MCKVHKQEEKKIKFGVVKNRYQINATNEVSGTSEFLSLEPPVRVTGAGKSSLRENHAKLTCLHIFQAIDLGDSLE